MDHIFKARYTGCHFRNVFSFLQIFTPSFNESPLNLRVQFSSFLKFSFCSLPIFKHQKIYGIILSESSQKRHAFDGLPVVKTQHLICFQVILPLLFDFSVRRHIYLTTTTVYAIYLEKTARLWSFIYLLLSICCIKTTHSLIKLNGCILCLGRSHTQTTWFSESARCT